MAKRKNNKKGFAIMDYAVIGGVAVAAYFLFKQFKNLSSGGNSGTGNNTGGGTNTGGGPFIPPPTTCTSLLPNGFPKSSFTPTITNEYLFTVPETQKVLRIGSTGLEVMALQIWINWGREKSKLIEVDGVLGPKTWLALTEDVPHLNTVGNESITLATLKPDRPNAYTIVGLRMLANPYRIPNLLTNCPALDTFKFGSVKIQGISSDGSPMNNFYGGLSPNLDANKIV
jgi:hypothetical protein